MDIFYEETTNGLTDLHIALRYKVLPGKSPHVRVIKQAGKRKQSNPTGEVLTLRVDDEFRYNGDTMVVRELLDNGMVKCTNGYDSDSDASVVELQHDEVLGMVQELVQSNKRRAY